nr:MAG TPA: hypothetical protein [Caudoviricetes sp.]
MLRRTRRSHNECHQTSVVICLWQSALTNHPNNRK